MILFTPEQVAASQKTYLDVAFRLTAKVVEGMERWAELNLQTIRSTLAETQENALKAFSVNKPQWLALQAVLAGPTLEKAQSYGQAMFEIMATTQAEFAQVAQAQGEAYNRRAVEDAKRVLSRHRTPCRQGRVCDWRSSRETPLS